MATRITRSFRFEELDEPSRRYLLRIRDHKGQGMPGVYVATVDVMSCLGCVAGIVVLVVFAIIAFNVITESPLAVAMLQTAGLLLGGWLIIAAVRIWLAAKGTRFAGHFIYADADTLWQCSGYSVTVLDLHDVVEARGEQNFKEGKYQNTSITVTTDEGRHKMTLSNMESARQLIVFLNTLPWMRGGGLPDGDLPGGAKQEVSLKNLPAPIMGGVAKALAQTGEMPTQLTASALDVEIDNVPHPQKEERASSSLLYDLLIIGIQVGIAVGILTGSVFLFKELNVGWRDDAIWDHIIEVRNQDQRVPLLRGYLADERNTVHRDDAKKMLVKIYEDNITRMKSTNAQLNFAGGKAQFVKVDEDLLGGFAEVLRAIAQQPQGVISVSVKETGGDGDKDWVTKREDEVRNKFTLKLFDGIGKELAFFVKSPDDRPGLIDISYTLERPAGKVGNGRNVNFTVKFRKAPDDDPVKTVPLTIAANSDAPFDLGFAAEDLGLRTAGLKKPEPPPLQGDF